MMGRHLSVFGPRLAAWYDIDRCSTPVLCLGQEISPARREIGPPAFGLVPRGRVLGDGMAALRVLVPLGVVYHLYWAGPWGIGLEGHTVVYIT